MEQREAWETLRAAGFLHGARDAHREATLAVFGGLTSEAGFTERSFGVASFDVLASRLDTVFTGTDIVRDDLNNSPGWRCGRYRVLLKRHEFGRVHHLRWDRASPTKQAVARQEYPDDPQLTFDLGPGYVPDTPEIVTLVLAHSATPEPLEMELFLGRPRFNEDAGPAWQWLHGLDDTALGADPRRKLDPPAPALPLWTDETDVSPDVPVRPRRGTSTETA